MSISAALVIDCAILAFCFPLACSSQASDEGGDCGQVARVQKNVVKEAEKKRFMVRRVEITGNSTIRHHEFVKRLGGVNEGDVFSRHAFEKAVRRIARMKAIYPITMRNTELRLDRTSGDVDILICVKERDRQ